MMIREPRGLALVAAVAVGCVDRVRLPDVPILGGSREQRDAAEAELLAFDDAVGSGRLTIASVAFEDLKDWQGRYRLPWHRVVLDEDLDPIEVRTYLRHELCHALDRAEGLLDDSTAPFDEFGTDLFDGEDGDFDYRKSARGRRSEALAQVCEVGPFGAVALSAVCAGEAALQAELASWVVHNVWRDHAASDPWASPETVATSDYAPRGEWQTFSISPTVEPTRVGLHVGYDDVLASVDVDLYTGEPAPGAPAEMAPVAEEPPLTGLPLGGDFAALLGWPSGPGAAVVQFPITGLRTGGTRLMASDGDAWALVGDGCLDQDMGRWSLFTADDLVWYAWGDGLTVSWAPLEQ